MLIEPAYAPKVCYYTELQHHAIRVTSIVDLTSGVRWDGIQRRDARMKFHENLSVDSKAINGET